MREHLQTSKEKEISIYDITGKKLFEQIIHNEQPSINIHNIFKYKGMAILIVKTTVGTYYKKIILQ